MNENTKQQLATLFALFVPLTVAVLFGFDAEITVNGFTLSRKNSNSEIVPIKQ